MAGKEQVEADDPHWPLFQARFSTALARLSKLNRGCTFCTQGQCQRQFAMEVQQIRRWRAKFHALPDSKVKDRELSWIFWRSGPGSGRADGVAPAGQPVRIDTSSSGEEEVDEQAVLAPHSVEPKCRSAAPKGKARPAAKVGSRAAKAEAKAQAATKAKAKAATKAKAKATTKAKAKAKPAALPPRIDTSSSEAESTGRINTSPSPSGDSDLDIVPAGAAAGPAEAAPAQLRRPYNAGRPRQPKHMVKFLGKPVCFQAARDLVGVGWAHLYRLKDGRIDGRSDGTKRAKGPLGLAPQATAMPSVLRFLWQLYHSVGEGMPDKFAFERPGLSGSCHALPCWVLSCMWNC